MDWARALDGCDIRAMEPMSRHTTFQIGGPADWMLFARDGGEVTRALAIAAEHQEPVLVIGNGSNLLVRDGGIRGLVIQIGEGMRAIDIMGNTLRAQAGASLRFAARAAMEAGLSGLEFAAGIPGNVGGAVAMNAGAYGDDISCVVSRVRASSMEGEVREIEAPEMGLGYRTSAFKDRMVVLEADFALKPGDREEIRARMADFARRRSEKQPLDLPSAGSTFKRPPGLFAGKLIEDAGLKGLSVGGAQVSRKHAGFIVNTGGATARDVLELVGKVQASVRERFGVLLELEIRVIGEDAALLDMVY